MGDKYEFRCQHGPSECEGNMVQSCAIHQLNNINQSMPFVYCMMSKYPPNEAGEEVCYSVNVYLI